MKNLKYSYMKKLSVFAALFLSILVVSCKKSFLDRPALDQPSLETYYQTAAQVKGATGVLYGYPWFDFQDKAFHCIGEVMSGNGHTWDGQYNSFLNFTTQSTDARLAEASRAFYKVIGWSNVIINTFEQKKAQGGDPAILNPGIAEAKFIRATAYFYVARIWGDAPIITNPVDLATSGNFKVPRHIHNDILRFAIEDLQAAEVDLPETADKGRVSKYSAKGMMAKVYLYKKDWANAKLKAGEVIQSNKYDLFPDYAGMFNKSANNNNIESLFALQWMTVGDWGVQNTIQAFMAPGNLLVNGDGWSAVVPSLDLLASYEAGDKRKEWSNFQHGQTYPDWKNNAYPNGYRYDTAAAGNKRQTRTNSAKYIVGPGSAAEPVQFMRTSICNYILRYADVLLIYAEATLGDNASTSDGTALAAINKVRARALLLPLASFTKDQVMRERRSELAFEGDYWFDLQRQGFTKAKQIIDAQERGTLSDDGTQIYSMHVTTFLSPSQLWLPIPQNETSQNPKLLEPAIPYY
jgi:starch-binding outer membrane protein, SusD/RagB family